VVAVPVSPRFIPVVLAAGVGVAAGMAVSSWMATDGAPLTQEIDALDRTSLLASAGLSPRRALAGLERLDPAAAAVIGRSVDAAARRSGRGEVVLRVQASELRAREKAAAEARAVRAPASIGTLAATCVLPAIVFLVAGPAAVG
jgi:hypothetical protein